MFHSQATSLRYMRMERAANMEAMGMAGAAVLVGLAGWIGGEDLVTATGVVAFLLGVFIWMARRLTLRHRRVRTPGMIFIAYDGIGAILPSGATAHLEWNGLSAREFRFTRGGLPENVYFPGTTVVGIRLKDRRGGRIYVTHDLDGYNEMLEILLDLEVPIIATRNPILGARGRFTEWSRGSGVGSPEP